MVTKDRILNAEDLLDTPFKVAFYAKLRVGNNILSGLVEGEFKMLNSAKIKGKK